MASMCLSCPQPLHPPLATRMERIEGSPPPMSGAEKEAGKTEGVAGSLQRLKDRCVPALYARRSQGLNACQSQG